jgi:hypothetical protein
MDSIFNLNRLLVVNLALMCFDRILREASKILETGVLTLAS